MTVLELVAGRRGHFRMESGYHAGSWLDLDALFADARAIDPLVDTLARALQPYALDVVCGALLGGAFLAQLLAIKLGVVFAYTERFMPPERDGLFAAQYRLPPAFAGRLRGTRVAIVDDIMSAGSALRGTYVELERHGVTPVVAAALLVQGTTGADFFAARGVPVEAVDREPGSLWRPDECPLCRDGMPLEDLVVPPTRPTPTRSSECPTP